MRGRIRGRFRFRWEGSAADASAWPVTGAWSTGRFSIGPNKGSANGYSHFAVKAERDGEVLDARVLQGDLLPPYSGSLKAGAGSTPFGSGPPRSHLSAAPHFRTASFRGEFPIAVLSLRDDAFPGAVTVTAFNPFIPLDEDDSSIPAAFFEVEVHNPCDAALTYTVCLSVNNPVPGAAKVNRFQRIDGLSLLGMGARGPGADGQAAGGHDRRHRRALTSATRSTGAGPPTRGCGSMTWAPTGAT